MADRDEPIRGRVWAGLAGVSVLLGLAVVCGQAAFAADPAPTMTAPAKPAAAVRPVGYLPSGALPNSLKLDPPPPASGSAALARDEEAARAALALRGTARWDLARSDADLFGANPFGMFSCAADFGVGPKETPRLEALLRKATMDLALAVYPTKRTYQRARPFMVNGQPICTPESDAGLRHDGSYPSGHSAIGYGWSLVLAELIPDRAAELVARGRAIGDSRRVCNVHWLSDVEEGRVVATATVARLHAEPAFRADMEAAGKELAAAKAKGAAAPKTCAVEAAALAMH